jgi:hypothetical protein
MCSSTGLDIFNTCCKARSHCEKQPKLYSHIDDPSNLAGKPTTNDHSAPPLTAPSSSASAARYAFFLPLVTALSFHSMRFTFL